MKKDQNLANKNIHINNSSDNYKASRQQSSFIYNYRGRSTDQKKITKFLTK